MDDRVRLCYGQAPLDTVGDHSLIEVDAQHVASSCTQQLDHLAAAAADVENAASPPEEADEALEMFRDSLSRAPKAIFEKHVVDQIRRKGRWGLDTRRRRHSDGLGSLPQASGQGEVFFPQSRDRLRQLDVL